MTATTAPPEAPEAPEAQATPQLSHGLKQRHLSMIALGGVIGAGLFVGSGAGIAAAGPGIILAFTAAGLLVMLIMRMLGEMSAAHPASGSFSVHAEREIGPWAGLTAGWMYWVMLCCGVAAEATAAGSIMNSWLPGVPGWGWVAVFMAFFCASNLTAVKNFGEFEFWFAAVKITAIVAFLVLGVLGVTGVLHAAPGTGNLTGHGGFLPHGTSGLITGLLASVFAYGGLETVTIAAAESDDPRRNVANAVRTAVWRIAVFYIGSMALVVTLVPWNDPDVVKLGPYVTVLRFLHIPGAAQVMQAVVLIALLSAMNANIYGSSRMAYSLVSRGQGPKALARVSGGVPRLAVLASCAFGFGAVLAGYWWPDTVFTWLMNTTGVAILVVWLFIGVSQLRMRRRLEREAPEQLVVRMWAYPYLTWVAIAGVVALLALMTTTAGNRDQLYAAAVLVAALGAVGYWRQRRVRGA
ncbi:amino acid permease [Kitasatospora viridis]|uniref:Amino acid/polyamine/organocation transporter (APC superfamily) n=1 Tax=Kitasatospora viridis TaxID=281105 RepID=A0A561UKY4_9ACTN|nr:amino acid permease [Kitasatospora viridis]TWG00022.1 amino acid/polyamine/organocation transporter (APC superfamily) [Kitasatospora viridis]